MNPHTASLDECRDYIAECKGWKRPGYKWPNPDARSSGCWTRRDESVIGKITYHKANNHPIPATLDAAAWCLPEGWAWTLIEDCGPLWSVMVIVRDDADEQTIESALGETELLARFRAAALAWMRVFGDNVNKEKQE